MHSEIDVLKNFIEEYGQDFCEDGTKEKIIESLDKGDVKLALEILDAMERDWIKKAIKKGKFLMFTDYIYTKYRG